MSTHDFQPLARYGTAGMLEVVMQRGMQLLGAMCLVSLMTLAVVPAWAQQSQKQEVKRIGVIYTGPYLPRRLFEQTLLEELRGRGYVEGRNLVVERRYGENSLERILQGAKELAALNLDVVVAGCTPSTRALQQLAARTPVVMVTASDPVGQGFIQSFARPGGNITGNTSQGEDVIAKTLELLSEMLPPGPSVGVLYNVSSPAHARLWESLVASAAVLKRSLVRLDVTGVAQYAAAFEKLAHERAGGLLLLPDDHLFVNTRAELVALVSKHRVPAAFHDRQFVVEGGLMSYGPNLDWGYRNAAAYVDRILKGASASTLPVERPTRFYFVVNLNAAKNLGITVPPSMLLRADEVIR